MPPAEQIQRLDPGQRADKDPLDMVNDFLELDRHCEYCS